MKFNSLNPEFYVFDYSKSLHFYVDILGFRVAYTRENPKFAFLTFENSQIMIQEIDPNDVDEYVTGEFTYPLGRGINFQIDTNAVEKIAESLKNNNYPLRRDVQDSWYKVKDVLHGCRQILVQDPNGYLLRFSQGIGTKPINTQ